ncbi:hypothetical protein [Nocardia pseudovaccinii]|uniref:hypothetical protein n=1 Tax=Nocardia pseudovaccinii TaxID=189540 RepID=UPI000B321277|nr:hypothetical protein [Nocardia pseudovaccinii]
MARMLYDSPPPYRGKCRYSGHGCRCYLHRNAHGRHAALSVRRANRAAENRRWRASAQRENTGVAGRD